MPNGLPRRGVLKKGRESFVRSTLQAVPAKDSRPFFQTFEHNFIERVRRSAQPRHAPHRRVAVARERGLHNREIKLK